MDIFEEVNLTVVELPIEIENDVPVYRGFLRELPLINGEGTSRQTMYRQLAEGYQAYLEAKKMQEAENPTEEMTSSLLSYDQLLKYYDGETFDGFQLPPKE